MVFFPFEPNWVQMNAGKLGTSKNSFKVTSKAGSNMTAVQLEKAVECLDDMPYKWVHEVEYLDLALGSDHQRLKFGAYPDAYGFLKVCLII